MLRSVVSSGGDFAWNIEIGYLDRGLISKYSSRNFPGRRLLGEGGTRDVISVLCAPL